MKIAAVCASVIIAAAVCAFASARAQPVGGKGNGIVDPEPERRRPFDRTVINETTPDPVKAFNDALTRENPIVNGEPATIVVELCVDLDLTGHPPITIGRNRWLIASPSCARGPRSLGPQIYVTKSPSDGKGGDNLFIIRGSDVLFSGFRLKGPNPGIWGGDENTPGGIKIKPFDEPFGNVEISNMEIYYWSGAGISVEDNTETLERGRLFNTNEGAVRVRNNYLHDNQHDAGLGYGVTIGDGAYALIEHNVFERNRHAAAGGSSDGKRDYSGYTLRENLILPGGGMHCLANWGFQNCWYTHQIDMHGTEDRWYLGEKCCGIAGETMLIERNTILYTGGSEWNWGWHGYAIKIRGNPAHAAIVDGNVFKHANRSDAIDQNGDPYWSCSWWPPGCRYHRGITRPIQIRPNNYFGIDPIAQLGECNFAGVGEPDQFMATGVTWWAKSKTTGQWRYLNTMPEKLAELQLIDLDNDGKCDVAERSPRPELPPRRYSKSGIGPWQPWGGAADPALGGPPGGGRVIP